MSGIFGKTPFTLDASRPQALAGPHGGHGGWHGGGGWRGGRSYGGYWPRYWGGDVIVNYEPVCMPPNRLACVPPTFAGLGIVIHGRK